MRYLGAMALIERVHNSVKKLNVEGIVKIQDSFHESCMHGDGEESFSDDRGQIGD